MTQTITTIVFTRLPVPGRCKTRLAAGVGNQAAADFYRVCAEHAVAEAVRMGMHRAVVYCSTAEEQTAVQAWLHAAGLAVIVKPQVQHLDLGQRMLQAMLQEAGLLAVAAPRVPCDTDAVDSPPTNTTCSHSTTNSKGGLDTSANARCCRGNSCNGENSMANTGASQPAATAAGAAHLGAIAGILLIGSDIPNISAQVLDAAATALTTYDMVLGPAADGGYYLIGLSAAALLQAPLVRGGQLFQGVTWSTSSVLQQQVAAAEACGLTIAPLHTLPTLQDIDVAQDAITWLQQQGLAVGPSQPGGLPGLHTVVSQPHAGHHQPPAGSSEQTAIPNTRPSQAHLQQPHPAIDPLVHNAAQHEAPSHRLQARGAGHTLASHSLEKVQEAALHMLQAAGVGGCIA